MGGRAALKPLGCWGSGATVDDEVVEVVERVDDVEVVDVLEGAVDGGTGGEFSWLAGDGRGSVAFTARLRGSASIRGPKGNGARPKPLRARAPEMATALQVVRFSPSNSGRVSRYPTRPNGKPAPFTTG